MAVNNQWIIKGEGKITFCRFIYYTIKIYSFSVIKSIKVSQQFHILYIFTTVNRCLYICSLILCPHYNGIKVLLAVQAHFLSTSSLLLLEESMQLIEERWDNGSNLENVWPKPVPEAQGCVFHYILQKPRFAFQDYQKHRMSCYQFLPKILWKAWASFIKVLVVSVFAKMKFQEDTQYTSSLTAIKQWSVSLRADSAVTVIWYSRHENHICFCVPFNKAFIVDT